MLRIHILVQSGMFWNVPPIVPPGGTVTLPPIRSAVMSWLRSAGDGSNSCCRSCVVMNVPCEWPITTTFRPPFWYLR